MREQLQAIAEEVRRELQGNPPKECRDPVTLKGVCHWGAYGVITRLDRVPFKEAKVLTILTEGGTVHLVALVDGLFVDPTITQAFPEEHTFVYSLEEYPISGRAWTNEWYNQYIPQPRETL